MTVANKFDDKISKNEKLSEEQLDEVTGGLETPRIPSFMTTSRQPEVSRPTDNPNTWLNDRKYF